KRERAAVGTNGANARKRAGEAVELGAADRRDPVRPRVERLEEVVGRPRPERRVGDADVDDRRLRPGPVELEEEAQLPLPAQERDARGDPAHETERSRRSGAGSR